MLTCSCDISEMEHKKANNRKYLLDLRALNVCIEIEMKCVCVGLLAVFAHIPFFGANNIIYGVVRTCAYTHVTSHMIDQKRKREML